MAEEQQKSAYSSETIISEGNLTADPKDISRGEREAVSFRIACGTRNWSGDEATFYRSVVVRNSSLSEHILNSFQKGDRVIVHGRVTCNVWTDKEGDERIDMEIVADTVGSSVRWHDAAPDRSRRNRSDDDDEGSRGRRSRRRKDDDDEGEETTRRSRRSRAADDEGDGDGEGDDEGEDAGRGRRSRRSSGTSRRSARGTGRAVSRHSDGDEDDDELGD